MLHLSWTWLVLVQAWGYSAQLGSAHAVIFCSDFHWTLKMLKVAKSVKPRSSNVEMAGWFMVVWAKQAHGQ